jgi:Tyrosine phosphatase family
VLEYLEGAFDQIRRERGSIGGYLRNRLGVSDPVAASIRTDPQKDAS